MLLRTIILLIFFSSTAIGMHAQNSQPDTGMLSPKILSGYLESLGEKADKLEQMLDKKSEKAIASLQKQEHKIQRKLAKLDSLKARQVFGDAAQQYARLQQKLQKTDKLKQYIPSLDTLATSLKFLQQNPEWIAAAKNAPKQLEATMSKVKGMTERFQKAEEIKQFLKERRQYLKEQLSRLGFAQELKQLNKQVYYYHAQLNEYKSLLKDHKKAERKALALLTRTRLFKDFMRRNSQLAALFRLPGDPNDPVNTASLAGLQTRAQVNNLIQQQIATGGPGAQQQFQQNVRDAQSQLNQLKNKIMQAGASGSEDILPEGFKPNNQKTKSFLRRLELGTNIQSQRANGFFPVTSDIGLSLGYKLNDKSMVGIGASYKVGWGKDIRHIAITHQGMGLRSFVDWKIKKSFWLSGGYEMNYRPEPDPLPLPPGRGAAWQQSGLLGVSKIISLKTKFFKKTKLQLLWDFLSYQQTPRTQPVVFRIGYSF